MDTETLKKIKEVFVLFGVRDFFALSHAYAAEDQRLMKNGEWDDESPFSLINQAKALLEQIDVAQLDQRDREWRQEILWLWYHHAISCAIGTRRDRQLARSYASKALEFQASNHPNRITRLLWYLVYDQLEEAERWTEHITEDPERTTAQQLIVEYKKGEFF